MDPMTQLLILGIVGGAVFGALMKLLGRRSGARPEHDVFRERLGTGSFDVINLASIRVAGLGGLGMIAVAFATAWTFPRIGQTIILGAVCGVAMAAILIWRRRREGPLSTSSGRPGANTTLRIDQPQQTASPDASGQAESKGREIRLTAGSI